MTSVFLILLSSCDTTTDKAKPSKEEIVEVKDPLPSWNDVKSKENIINYVEAVTKENSEEFIPVGDRIATFDNDGNLWSEQPIYFQLFFAIDRVKAMAEDHPEWKNKQPLKAV